MLAQPLISIIVTTYNPIRKDDVFDLVNSLGGQTLRDFELVVIVEDSADLFRSIHDMLDQSSLDHRVVFVNGRTGISHCRNVGIETARGEILAFTDDDAIISPDWCRRMANDFRDNPSIIGLTGEAAPLWIDSPPSWFPETLHWMIGCTTWRHWNHPRLTAVASGVNMAFRREAFRDNMFSEEIGGGASSRGKLWLPNEDNELTMRICHQTKRLMLFDPSLRVIHKVYPFRLNPSYIRRYAFWQGCAEARYLQSGYSERDRSPMIFAVLKGAMHDVIDSGHNRIEWRTAARKLGVLLLTASFFAIGYVSYSLHIYKQVNRLV